MNANTKGVLYVKQDRINKRIDDFSKYFLKLQKHNDKKITFDDFNDFIKSIHLIVNTELNEKGVERKWGLKTSLQKSDKQKIV